MNILVIGGGGREHALCWALRHSPETERLFCAPGNAGIAALAECVALDLSDHAAVAAFARAHGIGLVVVGPEQPLADGLVDHLAALGVQAFGPSRAAARLESSKAFAKALCNRLGVPTAAHATFDDAEAARAYAATQPLPIVVKADGLAAGKGVVIAETREDADAAIDRLIAGGEVVLEEFLEGEEVSLFALVDGRTALPFGSAQDHKRLGDGDTGPNTGGMGAYSPPPALAPDLEREAMRTIIGPVVAGMAARGTPFVGFLYAGLMLTPTGPKLIEFNVRLGDPEAQAVLPRLRSPLAPLLSAAVAGRLDASAPPRWSPETALTVVVAATGYPGEPVRGGRIAGIEEAEALGALVFHAGTRRDAEGALVADSGRVLGVTGMGGDVAIAQANAYAAVDVIDFEQGFCRRDIGWRAVRRKADVPADAPR